jgi:pimeloyl-ACP methyl ester carboxylesterase
MTKQGSAVNTDPNSDMSNTLSNAAAPTQAIEASNARFLEKPGMRILRTAFRTLDRTCPPLAVQLGWFVLSTPPRFAPRPHEQTVQAQASTRSFQLGRKRIALYEWGSGGGPVALLVHCWGGRAMQMGAFVAPLLARGWRVVAFDAPAHGQSSGRRTDMIEFAQTLAAVAAHLGSLGAIVGHSFGAGMTQLAYRHHGLSAERIVMISSFTESTWITDRFGEFFGLSPQVIEGGRRKFARHYAHLGDWQQLSVKDALRDHTVPTLIVHDTQDQEIGFTHAQQLHAVAPHSRLLATSGLGHRRILRDADVVQQVVDFVALEQRS